MPGKNIYRSMRRLNARMAANYRRGIGPIRMVLLLTTTGRKSGQPHLTPLQYEEIEQGFCIAAARGQEADWFKNILVNPQVQVQIGQRQFNALAEPVTEPGRIADFLELRLRRHPLMVRLIMHVFDRLPLRYKRCDLEEICKEKAMVILREGGVRESDSRKTCGDAEKCA